VEEVKQNSPGVPEYRLGVWREYPMGVYWPAMAHTIKDTKRLSARISRIRGQLNAIDRALRDEKDCYLILQTTAACHGALNSLMVEILESHIRHHLLEPESARVAERRKAARELITIINAFLR